MKQPHYLVAAEKNMKQEHRANGKKLSCEAGRISGHSQDTSISYIIKGLMLFDRAEWARTARDKANIRHILKKEQRTKALGEHGSEHEA